MLTAAVVFAIAMGALESGGWWWAWLTGITLVLTKGVRLPLLGVKLNPTNAYIMRENRKTRRHNRHLAQQRRRRIRDQRRAQCSRRRQTQ
ncbi:MAG: hypothetical protein ACRDRU_09050 [Pseudonocardiaceae bacterium]